MPQKNKEIDFVAEKMGSENTFKLRLMSMTKLWLTVSLAISDQLVKIVKSWLSHYVIRRLTPNTASKCFLSATS